ncbi:RraA family protein [Citrobacter sp. R56]|uniref:RraA family protein n=1 Tax=Citrobacter sp. R56 TaxID=1573676 RepID=UPI00193BB482|nr:RraA family protein [Citrobacter sp. R56]QRG79891.1 RraA family protein [Citrobacter sp. R56]
MSNTGFRIFTEFNRPDPTLVNNFNGVPVANIADCMNRSSVMASRICKIGKNNLLGVAFTVKTRAGDNLMVHKALQMALPGDVIIVDARGDVSNAIMGELMIRTAEQKKLAGIIIDGAIRDVAVLSTLDIPVYAVGVTPAGPFKEGPGEINVPISVGGVVVNPGDILVGDDDGVVVISPGDAEEIYEKAKSKGEKEFDLIKLIKEGRRDNTWVDQVLLSKKCEFINSAYNK